MDTDFPLPPPPPLSDLPSDALLVRATNSGRKVLSAYERRSAGPTVVDSASDEAWSRLEAELGSVGSNPSSDYDRYFWQKVHNPNRVLKLCRYFSGMDGAVSESDLELYRARSLPSLAVANKWRPTREWGLCNKKESVSQLKRRYEAKRGHNEPLRASSYGSVGSLREERVERATVARGAETEPRGRSEQRHETTVHLTVGSARPVGNARPERAPSPSNSFRGTSRVLTVNNRPSREARDISPSTVPRSYSRTTWMDATDGGPAPVWRRARRRGPASDSDVPDLVRSPEWIVRASEIRARREEKERRRLAAFDAQLAALRVPAFIDSVQTAPQRRQPSPVAPALALVSKDPRRFQFEVERRGIGEDYDKNRNYFESVSREADRQFMEKQRERQQLRVPESWSQPLSASAPNINAMVMASSSPRDLPRRPVNLHSPRSHFRETDLDGALVRRPSPKRTAVTVHCQPRPDPALLNPYGDERTSRSVTVRMNPRPPNPPPVAMVDNVYKYVRAPAARVEPQQWSGPQVYENGHATAYRVVQAPVQKPIAPPGYVWDSHYRAWRRHENGVIVDPPHTSVYNGWVQ